MFNNPRLTLSLSGAVEDAMLFFLCEFSRLNVVFTDFCVVDDLGADTHSHKQAQMRFCGMTGGEKFQ